MKSLRIIALVNMNQKLRLGWFFALFGILLMTSSNVWGETWNRAVINSSKKVVTVKVQAYDGNVWFGSPCNNENGPCTVQPGTRVEAKFTTTAGKATGSFWVSSETRPPGVCHASYSGSSLPLYGSSVHFTASNCAEVTEVPGWSGYLDVSDYRP